MIDVRQEFEVVSVQDADGVRVSVTGELDLATVPTLQRVLDTQRAAEHDIWLDLSGLDFIDSMGIRTVVEAMNDAKRHGWTLAVDARLTRDVRRAFEISGLMAVLPFAQN
jgi:anti-sigma B factor antagonist